MLVDAALWSICLFRADQCSTSVTSQLSCRLAGGCVDGAVLVWHLNASKPETRVQPHRVLCRERQRNPIESLAWCPPSAGKHGETLLVALASDSSIFVRSSGHK
jgi:WD40 repeat protein